MNCKDYYIYADVSVDIESEFMEENDIRLMKMQYSLGEEQLIYEKCRVSDEFMHDFINKTITITGTILDPNEE